MWCCCRVFLVHSSSCQLFYFLAYCRRHVQGPPGTGKTSTIIAIISALLGKHYTPPNPKDPKAKPILPEPSADVPTPGSSDVAADLPSSSFPDGAPVEGSAKGRACPDRVPAPAPKFRILVCAQSNAAIDEVIARLASPGLLMGESCNQGMWLDIQLHITYKT